MSFVRCGVPSRYLSHNRRPISWKFRGSCLEEEVFDGVPVDALVELVLCEAVFVEDTDVDVDADGLCDGAFLGGMFLKALY